MGKRYKKKFQKISNNIANENTTAAAVERSEGIKPKRTNYAPTVSLKEDQVGITEYVSPGNGFQGILKSRYSDFHVNEIDMNGHVLELNDLTVPQPKEQVMSHDELLRIRAELKEILNEETWNKIKAIHEKNRSDSDNICYIETTDVDKEKRTSIHKIIKQIYNGKIVSSTVNGKQVNKDENKKFIRIMKAKGGRERNIWTFSGEYVHFLVHKENWDTSDVATQMADRLNLRPSQVNYCGTKDRRAKTTQKFCVKKRFPKEILHSVRKMHGVRVGNFEFSADVLKLGQLQGNRFRIALRHVRGDHKMIEHILENLKEKGFINYFGLQRFGNCATVPTYEVGVALLKADYKLACELILRPRDGDTVYMKEMREYWWKNRNSYEAAMMIHNDKLIEKKLLEGLAHFGENDYATALRKLPRNMLLLYPHAFQSLIFNRIVSRRIKEFGLILIPGDLVYYDKTERDHNFDEITSQMMDINYDNVNSNKNGNDNCDASTNMEIDDKDADINSMTSDNSMSGNPSCDVLSKFQRKVKALSEQEIESGTYSIFDVILPLPGHDITYPDNIVRNWYNELLNSYNLDMNSFKHKIKMFAMPGAYRKMLLKPENLTWEFKTYRTAEEILIASDWERVNGYNMNKESNEPSTEGQLNALLLEFSLPSAAYATMLLRELLKSDISATGQIALEETVQSESQKKCNTKETDEAEKLKEMRKHQRIEIGVLDTEIPLGDPNKDLIEKEMPEKLNEVPRND